MAYISPEEETTSNPIVIVFNFLANYGWYVFGVGLICAYIQYKLEPVVNKWRQAREDAEYHKNSDLALSRMEAVQRAREIQQQQLLEASRKALEEQKEREEKKRAETAEKLRRLHEDGGRTLGPADDYMPLSGGASTSYRPPKRSACSRGGCGR